MEERLPGVGPAADATPWRVVWAALLLAFASNLLVNAVLYPPYRAPDERAHVDMSRYLAARLAAGDGVAHPPDDVRWVGAPVREAARRAGLGRDAPVRLPLARAEAPPRGERPGFSELSADEPSGARNQMTQHPPAYYLVTGVVTGGLERAGAAADLEVVALRLVGALLLVPLPLLCGLAARRLGAGERGAVLAGLVPLSVPMLAHIGASVNNDVLLIAVGAAMTPLLLTAGLPQRATVRAAVVGVLGGVALLTKGFGLAFPAWIALAYGAATWQRRRWDVAVRGIAAVALSAAVGGWWWVRNLAVIGEFQPHHAHFPDAEAGFTPDWWWWAGFAALRFVRRFWSEPDIAPGEGAGWEPVATLVFGALVCVGVVVAWRRGRAAATVAALFPFAALTALVLYGAAGLYEQSGAPFGIHGRYTYPGLVGLAALAGAAVAAPTLRARVAVAAGGLTAAGLQAWAWSAALGTYWGTEGGGLGDRTAALLAWSPLPPWLVVTAAAVHWVALPLAVVMACRARPR